MNLMDKKSVISEIDLTNSISTGYSKDAEAPDHHPGWHISAEIEGRQYISQHIRYERNPQNRKEAIRIQGHICKICGFDYDKIYGKLLADDYIEVHHIRQLSQGQQKVDPSRDFITVCANCHRMLHRHRDNNISVFELQELETVKRIKTLFEKL